MTAAASPLPSSAVRRILDTLKGVEAKRGYWIAKCPAHDDDQPSLSVKQGRDQRVLVNCHAGCSYAAIRDALKLSDADFFADAPARPATASPSVVASDRPVFVRSYDYTDRDGVLLFQACRFERPSDHKKTFRQRRPDGKGGWVWSIDGIEPVIYRWPEVAAAIESGRPIYVVEGEKDADTLVEYGYAATTNPMGAGKWTEAMSDALVGADVIILPDNDDAGRSHAQQIAASLTARRCPVRLVPLPDLPPKGDVSDWLAAGNSIETMEELIDATAPWHPDPANRVRWTLRDVLAHQELMTPPAAIVPRFAWAHRSTLLASAEKSGKSTLAGYFAAKVSTGSPFLDGTCARGAVLIFGFEEFIGDTARRLDQFGADGDAVHLVTRFRGQPDDRLSEVRSHVEAVAPRLVIVDTLMAYAAGAIDDAAKSAQMQPMVQSLTNLAHETGVALVLIHHARKADGKYRDSSAIGGAVDVIAEVFIPDETHDATKRRANVRGRIPQCFPFDFRFDGDTYALAVSTEAPIELRIVEYVRSHPGCSANDVADACMGNRKLTLSAITRLIAGQHLTDHSTGHGRKLTVPGTTLFGQDRPFGSRYTMEDR